MKNKDYLRERADALITLSEGETTVKTYHCTTINNGEQEGFVTLTDRRLILVETSVRNGDCRKTELPLEAVGGIDYRYKRGVNTGKIVLGTILVLLACLSAVLPLLVHIGPNWLKILLWAAAGLFLVVGVMLWCLRSPALFVLTIYSSYPMTKFLGFQSTSSEREERLLIKPAPDCQTMLRELGALVLDIRNFGAQAREKYLNRAEQKELAAERRLEEQRNREQRAAEEERLRRLEEKQRRIRIKEQRKLERESKRAKAAPKPPEDESDNQYFDILNK